MSLRKFCRYICAGNSFVIHSPYQYGKTSYLMALQAELEKKPVEAAVAYFDISDIGIPSESTQDEHRILVIPNFRPKAILATPDS